MTNRFQRYEKKFHLHKETYQSMLEELHGHIVEDDYHSYTISNVYYDNEDNKIIRHSISKPVFKQKLRIRSYDNENLFFEIKKKYRSQVFKRRVVIKADDYYNNDFSKVADKQTLSEIEYFIEYHKVFPKVALKYSRVAYKGIEDENLRITFDSQLKYSTTNLDIRQKDNTLKDELDGSYIMEIKVEGAVPVWLSMILDKLKIYSTPFSKYGYCYKKYLSTQNTTT